MKETEMLAITSFILAITPTMQANPVGGILAAVIALGLAYILKRHGK